MKLEKCVQYWLIYIYIIYEEHFIINLEMLQMKRNAFRVPHILVEISTIYGIYSSEKLYNIYKLKNISGEMCLKIYFV